MTDTLQYEEHSRNASYSNGKADLCGDLLQQFPDVSDEIRNTLYAIQHHERDQAISELKKAIAVINPPKVTA